MHHCCCNQLVAAPSLSRHLPDPPPQWLSLLINLYFSNIPCTHSVRRWRLCGLRQDTLHITHRDSWGCAEWLCLLLTGDEAGVVLLMLTHNGDADVLYNVVLARRGGRQSAQRLQAAAARRQQQGQQRNHYFILMVVSHLTVTIQPAHKLVGYTAAAHSSHAG